MAYNTKTSIIDLPKKNKEEIIFESWEYNKNIIVNNDIHIKGTTYSKDYKSIHSDIAEIYISDPSEVIVEGTLVKFGGKYEIAKTSPNDNSVFGVVSSKPGIVLNQENSNRGELVALVGRVPVRVIGKIKKFDKLTTSMIPGVARKKRFIDYILLKPTVGVSLEDNKSKNEKLVLSFVHAIA